MLIWSPNIFLTNLQTPFRGTLLRSCSRIPHHAHPEFRVQVYLCTSQAIHDTLLNSSNWHHLSIWEHFHLIYTSSKFYRWRTDLFAQMIPIVLVVGNEIWCRLIGVELMWYVLETLWASRKHLYLSPYLGQFGHKCSDSDWMDFKM
jgi:hypothetical protein